LLLALLAALTNPACGDDKPVREYLDEQTAASVTAAAQPLVFARERSDLAANARDYVSLVPIEVNRSGQRHYYWFGYLWSTIDRRTNGEALLTEGDQFVLLADGRPIRLQAAAGSLREAGVAEAPVSRPGREAVAVLFQADPALVNFTGHATDLSLVLIRSGLNQDYFLWRDEREAVKRFASYLGLEGP
jgi:hypothetical protein